MAIAVLLLEHPVGHIGGDAVVEHPVGHIGGGAVLVVDHHDGGHHVV